MISGHGTVDKYGSNTLTMTGVSTYSGLTTIRGGTLLQGAAGAFSANSRYAVMPSATLDLGHYDATIGGLSGAGTVQLGGHTLTIGADQKTAFDGTIANGNLVKAGTAEQILWSSSNVSNLATIRIDGGLLTVNGSTASAQTTVNAGGGLGGDGIVGNTTINGGALAPGNPEQYGGRPRPGGAIDVLTVQGNLVMTSASTYMVEVAPTQADRVNVTGIANLGGATLQARFAPSSYTYVAKQYTILNAAGGLGGTVFGSIVNTDLPSGFSSVLSYDASNVYLNLSLGFGMPAGLNGNQASVGRALTNFFDRTGGIPLAFGSLNAQGLTQVSGELATGSQQISFDVANQFLLLMTDPFATGRGEAAPGAISYAGEAMAYAPKLATDAFASMHRKVPAPAIHERWNMWAAGFGGAQATDGNAIAGSNNTKSSIYGMAVGADYWFSRSTVAGISMAGGGTNFLVTGGGSGRSDLFQLGGFVRHTVGATYISAAAAYGWQDITTDRTVTIGSFDQLRANFNANSYSGRVEVGHRFVTPWVVGLGLTPYAAFQVTVFDLPAYTENVVAGTNTFALSYASKTAMAPRSELGLRSDKAFAVNGAVLTLRGRAAWAHDTDRDRSASAVFQSLPGASFIVNGAGVAKHTGLTSASVELKWMNGWSIASTFEGEFSDVTRSYAGKGVVRYAW